MEKIEKVSIIGLGAMGSAYASQMAKFLPRENIRVIAGGTRGEKYKTEGIEINGSIYQFDVLDPAEKCQAADLLMFAVKFNQLEDAIKQARNHIGDDTIIFRLNGITSEEMIGETYGMEKLLYSVCFGIDSVRTGNSVHFKNMGSIAFGEKENPPGIIQIRSKGCRTFSPGCR
jgi:2-dehydropantoate 2-reductase